jgi:hypothetical protein
MTMRCRDAAMRRDAERDAMLTRCDDAMRRDAMMRCDVRDAMSRDA